MFRTGSHSPSDQHPPRPPLQPLPEDDQNQADQQQQPPSSPSSSSVFTTTLSYFTEPLTYTARSLVRRLSEDEAPTPLARALSANYNGSMTDPTTGVYFPSPAQTPKRRPSPFQPPPLTPLSLEGYNESTQPRSRLLSRVVAEEIRLLIPPRLQLSDTWHLNYSLEQNGSTLRTLYSKADAHRGKRGGFVLVVRDSSDGVFGAYLTDPPKPQPHYFGSGECFLWKAVRLPALPDLSSLPPPPSADTTHAQRMTTIGAAPASARKGGAGGGSSASLASLNVPSTGVNGAANGHSSSGTATPERIRFKAFPYTGENDFTVFCQADYLSVGGGDGHYGLWLNDTLGQGISETCPTFGNENLSDEGKKFPVLGVELWYIGS